MLEGRGRKILIVITLLLGWCSHAQQIEVDGGFVEDSLLIGQDINYWITARYPAEMEMIFPDSNYTFSPFEFSGKEYFSTLLLEEGLAYDSTVYTIQSYEIDLVQYLQLNAIVLNKDDSSVFTSPRDSIFLTELAPVVSDTTKLKTNLDYQAVNRQFNFPLMHYILGGLAILVLLLLLIFGKRILKYLKLKKLQRDYRIFTEAFDAYVQKLRSEPQPDLAEQTLAIWKKYQQQLDKVRFTTLTTKEIIQLDFAEELEKPLKSIDRMVYGKKEQEDIYQDFQQIEDFTNERFQRKIEEIKNGK